MTHNDKLVISLPTVACYICSWWNGRVPQKKIRSEHKSIHMSSLLTVDQSTGDCLLTTASDAQMEYNRRCQ